jgi:hypothetical protein
VPKSTLFTTTLPSFASRDDASSVTTTETASSTPEVPTTTELPVTTDESFDSTQMSDNDVTESSLTEPPTTMQPGMKNKLLSQFRSLKCHCFNLQDV